MISRGQFGKLAQTLREGGGFSVNVRSGKSPTEGFMVAAPGSKEYKIPAATATGGQLQAFTQMPDNAKQLKRDDRYFGGWGGRNYASLDVSQNIKPKEEVIKEYGRDVAVADARTSALDSLYARNEEAAYDLQKDDDLNNPHYDPERPKNTPGQ
jgi:hypothetical protein